MPRTPNLSRRSFLVAGASVPFLWTGRLRADAPSDRINLGFIGVGTMGRGHLGAFLRQADVQVVAVSDVVAERRESAKETVEKHYSAQKEKGEYKGCATFNDFRDLLKVKDLDAVVIATPDHWHALPCVLAANAGKQIYCEKPLTLTIREGRRVVEAAAKNKIIFQTGSQQRSEFGGKFRQAVEYIRNGRLGKLYFVTIGVGDAAKPCDLPDEPVPDGTDWEMWNGPSPKRGYNEVLCPKGIHKHFPAWRNYREYAGGGLSDMGAHHYDIAQWAMNMDAAGPVRVVPAKEKEKRGLRLVYANGVDVHHGGASGCTFVGERGTIYVDRGEIRSAPAKILEEPLKEKDQRVYQSTDHRRNWLDCIKSKKQPICPAEVGHRTNTVCQLANIGYWLGKKLTWDPSTEKFVGDDEANKLLDREMRAPWKWPA